MMPVAIPTKRRNSTGFVPEAAALQGGEDHNKRRKEAKLTKGSASIDSLLLLTAFGFFLIINHVGHKAPDNQFKSVLPTA